jgi:hypothetical protein
MEWIEYHPPSEIAGKAKKLTAEALHNECRAPDLTSRHPRRVSKDQSSWSGRRNLSG